MLSGHVCEAIEVTVESLGLGTRGIARLWLVESRCCVHYPDTMTIESTMTIE